MEQGTVVALGGVGGCPFWKELAFVCRIWRVDKFVIDSVNSLLIC